MIDHSRLSETALREAARAETLSLDPETPSWKRKSYKDDAAYLLYLAERHSRDKS